MSKQLSIPEKAKLIGGAGRGNRRIYISKKTYKKIFAFAKNAEDVQTAGVLLGEKIKADDGIIYLIIKGFIEAEHSEGRKDSITFTKETWKHIDTEKAKKPDLDVIGWVHTNPDRGYEITEYDHFFMTHVFEDEDAVEYVVDPVQLVEAFYLIEGNGLKRTDGFFLFIDEKARKSRKEAEEEFLIVDDNEKELINNSGDEKNQSTESNEAEENIEDIEDDGESIESIEFDEAPTDRLSENLDISNIKIVGKPSVILKVLISVLSIVVMLLIVVIAVLVLRIVKIEDDIKKLYDNDVVVAKYINTGETEESETEAIEEVTEEPETVEEVTEEPETEVVEETTEGSEETSEVVEDTTEENAE